VVTLSEEGEDGVLAGVSEDEDVFEVALATAFLEAVALVLRLQASDAAQLVHLVGEQPDDHRDDRDHEEPPVHRLGRDVSVPHCRQSHDHEVHHVVELVEFLSRTQTRRQHL